ncbi:hypothetical protein ACFVWR_07000 [Leifsonia sp. NPDC058292]|uniref:hypothetical protein n=1 Tax=Leifsonia sp. NPDC058292 TaxID=3346428 RepID=UPI0036DCA270
MTGAPSKKPWWVRARGQHGRGYTLALALFLTVYAGVGILTSLRNGNLWWAAFSVVGLIGAVWMWAVLFWEQLHRSDGKEVADDER